MKQEKVLAIALSMLVLSAIPADASAGDFVWSQKWPFSTDGHGNIEIYEYRDSLRNPGSLASGPACSGYSWDTAPIAVVFGGSIGTGYEYSGFIDIADRLNRKACTRVVYIRQVNPEGYFYNTGVADPWNPSLKVGKATGNIVWAMDRVLTYFYPSAKRVTYIGGSASAEYGAKLLEMKYGELIQPPMPAVPWSRVKRFVFAGPPLGNLATACRYTSSGALMNLLIPNFTGRSNCADYVNFLNANGVPDSSANIYGFVSEDAKTAARNAGLRVNMFIGSEDELFGWPTAGTATGPQGVENFMSVSNLWPNVGGIPSIAASAAPYVGAGITYGVTSATHSNVWSRPPVVKAVCYLAAKEASSINPGAENQYLARCDEP